MSRAGRAVLRAAAPLVALLLFAASAPALEYQCPDGTVCETYEGCPCLHKCPNGAPVTDPKLCLDAEAGAEKPKTSCPTGYRLKGDAVICVERQDLSQWTAADEDGRATLRAGNRCLPLPGAGVSVGASLPADPAAPLQVSFQLESGEASKAWTLARHVEKCE